MVDVVDLGEEYEYSSTYWQMLVTPVVSSIGYLIGHTANAPFSGFLIGSRKERSNRESFYYSEIQIKHLSFKTFDGPMEKIRSERG